MTTEISDFIARFFREYPLESLAQTLALAVEVGDVLAVVQADHPPALPFDVAADAFERVVREGHQPAVGHRAGCESSRSQHVVTDEPVRQVAQGADSVTAGGVQLPGPAFPGLPKALREVGLGHVGVVETRADKFKSVFGNVAAAGNKSKK